MMKKFQIVLALTATLLVGNAAFGQCKNFVKTTCKEALGDFVPSESFNAAKLFPGDEAEINMTFYSGEDYRLLVCAHSSLPQVNWQVLDSDSTVIFDNSQHGFTDHFDFRLDGAQQFHVKLKVDDALSSQTMAPQGCVVVMSGNKVAN